MVKKAKIKNPGAWIIITLISVFLLILAVYNLGIITSSLYWPYAVHYGEADLSVIKFSELYKSLNTYPYVFTVYPPLTYVVVELFGLVSPQNLPYFSEGLAVLISLIISLILIYFITKKITKGGKRLPFLACLLFLSSSLIFQWGISHEPIMFELAADLAALYLIVDYKDRNQLILSAVFISIAMMFRVTSFFVFLGLLGYLLITKRRRDAMLFFGAYVLIVAPLFLIFNYLTAGRFLTYVFVFPAITPLNPTIAGWLFANFLLNSWILFLLPFIFYWIYKNRSSAISVGLVVIGISLLTTVRLGADTYYYIPFYAFACIASAAGIDKLIDDRSVIARRITMLAIMLGFFALVPVASYYYLYYTYYSTNISFFPYQISIINQTYVGEFINNVPGQVLVASPTVAVAAHKQVLFEPSNYWVMQSHGLWNDTEIVSNVENQTFAVVAFPEPDNNDLFSWYPQIENATQRYYPCNVTAYGWRIYYSNESESFCNAEKLLYNTSK